MLVDAGPLVALIHAGDRNHERCKRVAAKLRGPLLTVWPAFTEAMYLLGFSWRAQDALWEMLHRDALVFAPLGDEDHSRMRELMKRYSDLPMDLADAALVRVGEREKLRDVFTLDKRDFSVYRPARLGRFRVVP
jgi:predicted nucleic acid-binding protein